MSGPIKPKSENAGCGFNYTVSEEQVEYHRKRTVKDILMWLEETNRFIYSVQTDEERKRMRLVQRGSHAF